MRQKLLLHLVMQLPPGKCNTRRYEQNHLDSHQPINRSHGLVWFGLA